MNIDIRLDPEIEETEVMIRAKAIDQEVAAIQRALEAIEAGHLRRVIGIRGTDAVPLETADILLFHTQGKAVCAQTAAGTWQVRHRIRELVDQLDPSEFVQINQGEIVNLRFVSRMDLSLAGTIKLELTNGARSFVSRRSLAAFRTVINL